VAILMVKIIKPLMSACHLFKASATAVPWFGVFYSGNSFEGAIFAEKEKMTISNCQWHNPDYYEKGYDKLSFFLSDGCRKLVLLGMTPF